MLLQDAAGLLDAAVAFFSSLASEWRMFPELNVRHNLRILIFFHCEILSFPILSLLNEVAKWSYITVSL